MSTIRKSKSPLAAAGTRRLFQLSVDAAPIVRPVFALFPEVLDMRTNELSDTGGRRSEEAHRKSDTTARPGVLLHRKSDVGGRWSFLPYRKSDTASRLSRRVISEIRYGSWLGLPPASEIRHGRRLEFPPVSETRYATPAFTSSRIGNPIREEAGASSHIGIPTWTGEG